MVRIYGDTFHRANFNALTALEVTDAFRAPGPVDFVNQLALVNGIVRALRLTHIAVDAFICDQERHDVIRLCRPQAVL